MNTPFSHINSDEAYAKFRCTNERWHGRCINATTRTSYKFSMEKYGRPICFTCQEKMRKAKEARKAVNN